MRLYSEHDKTRRLYRTCKKSRASCRLLYRALGTDVTCTRAERAWLVGETDSGSSPSVSDIIFIDTSPASRTLCILIIWSSYHQEHPFRSIINSYCSAPPAAGVHRARFRLAFSFFLVRAVVGGRPSHLIVVVIRVCTVAV